MKKLVGFIVLALSVMVAGCMTCRMAGTDKQWSEKQAGDWYAAQPWLVGCNYLPATACNQLEMWQQETFDPKTIDKELGWASSLGFNVVRVFLHDMLWEQDAAGVVKRFDTFLEIADKHHIKVMPVLLDSCWDPRPRLGKQTVSRLHVHNSAWVQSPHAELLQDRARWGQLKKYVQGMVGRYRTDDRIIIWDIYNEPGNPNVPAYSAFEPKNKAELSLELMTLAFQWTREMKPVQPLSASVWTGDWTRGADIPALNKFALENSDLVQFHVYHGPEKTREWIKTLQAYNRPIICSEYMARTVGCTFEGLLPIFKEHRIAAINWGLVAGRSQTNYPWESWTKDYTAEPEVWFHDIFRPDGTPFNQAEAEFIKKITGTPALSSGDYKGWDAITLTNESASLHIIPDIGGRIIQYKLGDHEFFWGNPDLAGQGATKTGLDAKGDWLNYGGDKLWPAPQGWDNDAQWPGPPDGVLDGQPHAMKKLPVDQDGCLGIQLTSRNDPRSGIRFSRIIRLDPEGTRVSFEATMTNIDTKPRRWGIWAHTQLDAFNASRTGPNALMKAYCPINPNSQFPKGYSVIFGEKDNPSFQAANGMMTVNYKYLVGKIGLDSQAGWLATVNGETGHAFIQRFVFEADKPYPDGSSVEFWHNGIGSIQAYNKTLAMDTTIDKNPCVFESETLSPYARLAPGESYTYKYQWLATTVGGNFPVVGCTDAGAICQPLAATWANGNVQLTGRFGIFAPGRLRITLHDAAGNILASKLMPEPLSPLRPLVLDLAMASPAKPRTAIIEWVNGKRDRQGVLDRADIR